MMVLLIYWQIEFFRGINSYLDKTNEYFYIINYYLPVWEVSFESLLEAGFVVSDSNLVG